MDRHRVVDAAAPIRVCDLGGWTDTWFAGTGRILNIAVTPAVCVRLAVRPAGEAADRVVVHLDGGGTHVVAPDAALTGPHRLVEACLREVPVPDHLAAGISTASEAPPGSSTGTSASLTVALLAALDALTPGRRSPADLAVAGHRVETEHLGLQSGVQDQHAAASGGISWIEIEDYPTARVTRLDPGRAVRDELERRLCLVYLGHPHRSSEAHEAVIERMERVGGRSAALDALRAAAGQGRAALLAGDLDAFGAAMVRNTEAQASLHPSLVGPQAREVMAAAGAAGAVGWKVNGAGGDGGSLSLLAGPGPADRERLAAALTEADPALRIIPTTFTRTGVTVTVTVR